jgi:hypothetical protein
MRFSLHVPHLPSCRYVQSTPHFTRERRGSNTPRVQENMAISNHGSRAGSNRSDRPSSPSSYPGPCSAWSSSPPPWGSDLRASTSRVRIRVGLAFGVFEAGIPVGGLLVGHRLWHAIGTAARPLGRPAHRGGGYTVIEGRVRPSVRALMATRLGPIDRHGKGVEHRRPGGGLRVGDPTGDPGLGRDRDRCGERRHVPHWPRAGPPVRTQRGEA